MWIFLFNPGRGLITHFLAEFGYDWNHAQNSGQAMFLVVNLVYAFFDTFPVIDAATSGGPVQATTTLIYKIYREGFTGLDLASSAAQSVVLMFLVIVLTVVQFRYVESKVRYQ